MKVFQANEKPGFDAYTLKPMSAGDIIDRAARVYRRQAPGLLRIVLIPSLTSYTGMILFSIGIGNFSLERGEIRLVVSVLLVLSGGSLYLLGKAAFYAVLGGASRSLFNHLFDGTPFSAGEVYRSIRSRLWSLVGAMSAVLLIIGAVTLALYFAVTLVIVLYLSIYATLLSQLPTAVQVLLTSTFGLLLVVGVVWVALLVYSRVVYVPQVLMVEERSAAQAIGRSFSLAGGELRRIGALILFWFFVAWSLWVLMVLPLGWYGYEDGLEITPFQLLGPFVTTGPVWYLIAQQTLTQLSEILIAPIVMLGFTLLYVDTRIRKEGLDVEILADRILPPANRDVTPHAQGEETSQ
jgi:hypothetical protein